MLDNRSRSSRLRLIYFGESLVFFLRQQKIEWDEERRYYLLPRIFRKPVMVLFEFLTSCCRA